MALLFALSAASQAHHPPVAECYYLDGDTILCEGGFAGGGTAPGVAMDVIAYDETVLVRGKLDAESTTRFTKPPGEFYVLFDAGPGSTVEIDYRDILEASIEIGVDRDR